MQEMNNQAAAMEQYFCSLPMIVQESIKQSGVEFCNMEEMKSFVENLNKQNG